MMYPLRKQNYNADHVHNITSIVQDKKIDSISGLQIQFDSSTLRLKEEIESCKRKILQCTGQEGASRQSKKKKYTVNHSALNKENAAPNRIVVAIKSPSKPHVVPKKQNNVDGSSIELQVMALKVVELRKELRSRGMDANGLKKDLRTRLLKVMLNENSNEEGHEQRENTELPPQESLDKRSGEGKVAELSSQHPAHRPEETKAHTVVDMTNLKGDDDVEMIDASNEKKNEDGPQEAREKSSVITKSYPQPIEEESPVNDTSIEQTKETPSAVEVAAEIFDCQQETTCPKAYWENLTKPTPATNVSVVQEAKENSTESLAQPSKSPLRGLVKNAFQVFSQSTASTTVPVSLSSGASQTNDDAMCDEDMPPVGSQVSMDSKITGSKVRELVSKISNGSKQNVLAAPKTSNGSSSSTLSKSIQAKKEARLAKMEEARKARLAEIRGKSKPLTTSKTVATPKEYTSTLSSLKATAGFSSTKKKNLAAQMREKAAASQRKEDKFTAPSTGGKLSQLSDSTLRDPKPMNAPSPLETYEISDREDSDTDDSDESGDENEKQKKKIPSWAQKANLIPALERQYAGNVNGRRVDPDDIFPEVETCDLEAIFDKKKSRYTRRTSSGNWSRDRVTVAEKLVYKRTMGFASEGGSEA